MHAPATVTTVTDQHPCHACRNFHDNLPAETFAGLEMDQVLGALAGMCDGCPAE